MHIASRRVIAPARATSCTACLQDTPPAGLMHFVGPGPEPQRLARRGLATADNLAMRARFARRLSRAVYAPAPHNPSFFIHGGSAR
jgi:hypothetical protein